MEKDRIRILLTCSWIPSQYICYLWNKMSKGNFTWENIEVVWEKPYDYICIINKPYDNIEYNPKKTIIFRMEPNMENQNKWGNFKLPSEQEFLFVGYHKNHYNNLEWHLSKNYIQLSNEHIKKIDNKISTILSNKYFDPGHIKRIDFIKYIENKIDVDVYGDNAFSWKNYKGQLPYHSKDNGLIPYKYTFNCENHYINNYVTEKLVDGILSECLTFYSGCPNIKDIIDENAYVYLKLENFEEDYNIIKDSIANNLWEIRLPYIKKAKLKILNEMQFFPRLSKIVNNVMDK